MWIVPCAQPEDTRALGRALGESLAGPLCLSLEGDLGAGKTCFAQGAGDGLQVQEAVVSPTFVLVAEYEGRLPLLHADCYRLEPADAAGIGLEEALETWPGLALVEWAERLPGLLPLDHIQLRLDLAAPGRQVQIRAHGPHAAAALAAWKAAFGR